MESVFSFLLQSEVVTPKLNMSCTNLEPLFFKSNLNLKLAIHVLYPLQPAHQAMTHQQQLLVKPGSWLSKAGLFSGNSANKTEACCLGTLCHFSVPERSKTMRRVLLPQLDQLNLQSFHPAL